ncbi:MAG: M48 family metalloprotease [Alphaproteobacteria bacterium]|nr:M48 family metalloprotease [Rickettsiales bacterium]
MNKKYNIKTVNNAIPLPLTRLLLYKIIPLVFTIVCYFTTQTQSVARNVQIVSDTEIDSLIKDIASIIFNVAHLDASDIEVNIISDPNVNAFVYQNSVFVHTGLIVFAKNTDALFGVLAHETGHVARRHISRMILFQEERRKDASSLAILGGILMIGLAPLSASMLLPAILAPMIGFSAFMQGNLKYSRDKESEADQSAIIYLNKLGISVNGLYDTMLFFHRSIPSSIPEFAKYLYTHPLPIERMQALSAALKTEKNTEIKPIDCKLEFKLRRAKAKIIGYLDDIEYEKINNFNDKHECFSNEDIAFLEEYKDFHSDWKNRQFKKALEKCESLLQRYPKDAFLKEQQASLLMQQSRTEEAIIAYKAFVQMHNTPASRYQLSMMLTSSNLKQDNKEAVEIMKELIKEYRDKIKYYITIANAYLKVNNALLYNLNMAEGLARAREYKRAIVYANKVLKMYCNNKLQNCELIKDNAADISDVCVTYVKKLKKEKKKNRRK